MNAEKDGTQVLLETGGPVATVRLITEGGVNVFSSRVLRALEAVVAQLAALRDCRIVAFRGEGKIFVAGADINELSACTASQGRAFGELGHRVFNAIEALPQVTFALLNGHALGGGCELALACDFRIAVAAARLGQPECRLGLIPGWAGTQRLPRLIGLGRSRRLLMTGEQITADAALGLGLVDEVVPGPDDLETALKRWRNELAASSPMALRRIKSALRTGDELAEFAGCFDEAEAREGLAAFLEKRKPAWTS